MYSWHSTSCPAAGSSTWGAALAHLQSHTADLSALALTPGLPCPWPVVWEKKRCLMTFTAVSEGWVTVALRAGIHLVARMQSCSGWKRRQMLLCLPFGLICNNPVTGGCSLLHSHGTAQLSGREC